MPRSPTTIHHAGLVGSAVRCKFGAARLLRLWVRISPLAWMFVYCLCCVLSGRGLCDELINRPEECYWLWCVEYDLETLRIRRTRFAAPQVKSYALYITYNLILVLCVLPTQPIFTSSIYLLYMRCGARGVAVVEKLCYKSEGRWIDSRRCHWTFSFT
jgi:hypothetical protein